jgi:O-antigen/teichoic acid export membrane protein
MSQYLFPTFCKKHRISAEDGRIYFHRIVIIAIIWTTIFVVGIFFVAPFVILHTLGLEWMSIVPLVRVLCFTMAFGAIIAVLVVYARAIGRPELVTQASGMQVAMMLILAPPAVFKYGVIGMAWTLAICVGFAVVWIFKGLRKSN